jgi:hypothetical protein
MTRLSRRMQLAVGAGLLAALALGLAFGARTYSDDGAAPPAVLNHIAAKNEDAAVTAAARMKAESEATAAAADARRAANEAAAEAPNPVENAEAIQ